MDQDFSRDLLASDAFAPNISPRVSCPRFKADLVASIADTRSEDLGVALQFASIQQDNFLCENTKKSPSVFPNHPRAVSNLLFLNQEENPCMCR